MEDKHIKVLLIEDNPNDVELIRRMLAKARKVTFDLEHVDCLESGLVRLSEGGIDVVLLDLSLPDSQGLKTLARIQKQAQNVPIIVLTGLDDETLALKAVHEGAQDYQLKGRVDSQLLERSMLYAIERKQVEEELRRHRDHLEEMVNGRTAELKEEIAEHKKTLEKLRRMIGEVVKAMALMVEARDPYTAGHQQRVADLARAIATEMGLLEDQIDGIRMAGLVHDLGKISVPVEILNRPGFLNELEFKMINFHAQISYDILKEIEFPWPVARIVLMHHERIDGSGYPDGLKGEEILLEARILAVADVVEAMCSPRPYRTGLGLDKALEEISKNKGTLYDPEVVAACLRVFLENGYKFK